MNKYLQQLELYTFIQEHRFDPVMRNCKGIWENTIEKEWNKLCLPSEELIIILIVQEFYLALKQREATRPFYKIRSFVKVRGINVLVTEIWPIVEMSEISPIHAIIAYGILQKRQISIELCKRVGVPIKRVDKTMNPLRKLLRDDIFK
ncbi:hypothetical protein Gotur_030244 [Gossypium turneri]